MLKSTALYKYKKISLISMYAQRKVTQYQNFCYIPGKSSACNAGDPGSIPVLGRSPGEGNANPLQYFTWKIPWREESGSLPSMGSQESDTT